MVFTTWADVLSQSFQSLFYGVVAFIPNLVVAVVIFIVGWLVGVGLGRVVTQIINALRVDNALRSTGIERLLSRAGFELSSGKFLGFLVEWFFIIVFLVAALDVLGLTTVNLFISDVVLGYLPQVIVAVLILLVAAVVAEAVERVVVGSAKAASLHAASFLGKVARVCNLDIRASRGARTTERGNCIRADIVHGRRYRSITRSRPLIWSRRSAVSGPLSRKTSVRNQELVFLSKNRPLPAGRFCAILAT